MSEVPELSVVVEWENVLLARAERATAMLERLAAQLRDLGRSAEVLVVCDPGASPTDALRALLEARLGPAGGALPWAIVPCPGAHYYALKNGGTARARGRIVAFVDSDVVPEDGWLRELLAPFDDAAVQVVAGHSYVDPEGLYGRAMALGWFFPRRSETPVRHAGGTHFWANNVAFRRELLAAHPFGDGADGATRGACADLSAQLRREGIPIWVSTGAQVGHPAPNGFVHFSVRAVADGRDAVLLWLRRGKKRWKLPLRITRHYVKTGGRALWRTARDHATVGLPVLEVPAAWAIVGAYYGAAFVGALATWAAPGPMSRGFRV